MKTISDLFIKISNWKSFAVFLALYIAFNAYFLPKGFKSKVPTEDLNLPILDLQFGFNPERVKDIVSQYHGEAKEAYIMGAGITDGIYPAVYFCLFSIILTLVFYKWKISPWFKYLNLLPIGLVFFDYLENYHIIKMLRTYPENIDSLATYCSFFTLIKWVLAGIVLAIVIAGIVQNVVFNEK
ncbi:hypothetical protein [Lacihabitans sp. LS3-19]|uniref:hypothetical protein n=1 Tax=Lacihabitans sp. LS3-19 TaxID=2487335 RepID=UPI0020CD7735|nr:hypothetical protein [Lacihabitans sp. LS3-19]